MIFTTLWTLLQECFGSGFSSWHPPCVHLNRGQRTLGRALLLMLSVLYGSFLTRRTDRFNVSRVLVKTPVAETPWTWQRRHVSGLSSFPWPTSIHPSIVGPRCCSTLVLESTPGWTWGARRLQAERSRAGNQTRSLLAEQREPPASLPKKHTRCWAAAWKQNIHVIRSPQRTRASPLNPGAPRLQPYWVQERPHLSPGYTNQLLMRRHSRRSSWNTVHLV